MLSRLFFVSFLTSLFIHVVADPPAPSPPVPAEDLPNSVPYNENGYNGHVYFNTILTPNPYSDERPWLDLPTSTKEVSRNYAYESILTCFDSSPVYRVVNCDIMSWDSCGNIVVGSGEEKKWSVKVLYLEPTTETGHTDPNPHYKVVESRLVSPLLFLKDGHVRFYFTPIHRGIHKVIAKRNDNVLPLPLMSGSGWFDPDNLLFTNQTLEAHVIVHDFCAACTERDYGERLSISQDVLWAESAWLNERGDTRLAKTDERSPSTTIQPDPKSIYSQRHRNPQTLVRRLPVLGFTRVDNITRLHPTDNAQPFCDMLPRMETAGAVYGPL